MSDLLDARKYPTACGVYLMYDAAGTVLYVGKAKNLRTRLRSYFSGRDERAQIRFLLGRLARIETILTDTEKEALILENTLIKEHRPRYNIDLRDDKTYVSLRLDPQEEFPTLQVVRKVRKDGAYYFGPYASATAVRETLKEIYRIFPLRHHPLATCRRRGRPCLFHQIGQCSAPCHGLISPADYQQLVKGVTDLLAGRERQVIDQLRARMTLAAAELRYEEAARLRDQIGSILQTVEKQKVVAAGGGDQDVVGLHREGGEVEVVLLFVRGGKLIGRRQYGLEWRLDEGELLSSFLQEFYGREVLIPDQVLLPFLPEDSAALAEWLGERKGRKVMVTAPCRGEKRRLVDLADRNAAESFRERGSRLDARERVLEEIRDRLHLQLLPRRMECFDISNVQGTHTVGSMAVVLDGEPAPGEYRHYRIRSVAGSNDFAALAEVLERRLQRGKAEGLLPDLILIDGGKGQLSAVAAVLAAEGLAGVVDLVGIAKSRVIANVGGSAVERSEERFFLPGRKNPVLLRQGSPPLFLLERLRDEAHRFAITYHRKLRGKGALHSVLEEIPGVGARRRRLLLRHFGSLQKLREATEEALCAVPGVPQTVARAVYRVLHPPTGGKP
ncbi:excinuclease ABC subunit UvrC [Desulfuromonas carbonis]|uniref:excinuclease ABC subunit UvrC n=1 Tax=Desulfuromonas sp. DDH964 TaxID=1823759 RepID=UPI00078C1E12|nr:excinuclease ABC subunit UvrC [Desulfuromonas sp. DDH964]AMV71338.1 excinuclease ABC subunit C [Desulfuromonas sp. DDH964]